ncbi:MAG TPA: MFS transporter [Burkholderiales bacterium]|nr:MFS transporter [Burkholderiales bacterium]
MSRCPRGWIIGAFNKKIAVVVAANFIAVAARMSLVTFLGIYFVRNAGIDLATVGVAFLCEHLVRGLAAPLFGALSDRIGRRALLIASAATTAVVLPCFLLVEGPASLFAWSLALGLTGAVNMPVANALLLDLSPPERRQSALALNYTAMSVAYTLGVMPAGYVAEQGYGFLAATAAAGYALVVLLYGIFLNGKLPLERASRSMPFDGLRDPSLLKFAAVGFVFPFSMGLVVSATPLFAADAGVGEGYIGLVLGANSILVAALALPVAARIEASGPLRYLGAAALIVAAAHACYAAIPGVAAALLVGTIVFSFAELIFSSAVPATVARLAPPGRRGAYQGTWALVASVSMGSALFFSGVLREALGWRAAWGIYAGIALIAGLAFLLMRRSERPGGG